MIMDHEIDPKKKLLDDFREYIELQNISIIKFSLLFISGQQKQRAECILLAQNN